MSYQHPPDNGGQQWNPSQQQPYSQPLYPQQQPGYPPQQPYSQTPMQPPKKQGWKVAVGIISGVALLLSLCLIASAVASSGSHSSTASTVSSSSSSSPSQNVSTSQPPADTGSSAPATTIAKVGQTITVNNYSCTLVSIKTLAGDEFNTPKSGYQYAVAHLTLKNSSSDQVGYNPFDFHVKSSAGNVTDVDFATPSSYAGNNILNSGNLDPGGSVSGDLIVQVPRGDTAAQLTWQPSFFASNTKYGWTLGAY